MLAYSLFDLIERPLYLTFFIYLSVSCRKDYLVVLEHRMLTELFGKKAGALHALQQPECVLQLRTQLLGREREFFLCGKGIKEPVD